MQAADDFSCVKVADDVYFNDLYTKRGKGYWVIGRRSNASYMLVKAGKIQSFKKLISKLDGKHSAAQIGEQENVNEDEVIKIIGLLNQNGILEGSERKNGFNEAERLSIRLLKFRFKEPSDKLRKIARITETIFKILAVLLFAFTIITFLLNIETIKSISFIELISYNEPSLANSALGYILITLFSYFTGIPHEIAHAIASIKNGTHPDKISIVLYLGFMPMCYIQQRNIYSLKKNQVYEVLFAGVAANLFLSLLLFDLYLFFGGEMIKMFAVSNFKMVYANLIPLSLTDGYFIFSLLFRIPNSRMNFYKCFAYPRLLLNFPKRYVLIFLIYFAAILIMLNSELFIILSILNIGYVGNIVPILAANLIYIYILHLVNKFKVRDVSLK